MVEADNGKRRVRSMNTATRLAQLNTACKGSLSITHYESDGWVIHSYKTGTPLEMDGVNIADHDIKVAVKKAWDFVFENEVKKTGGIVI
jgi:hypothetical protein